MVSFFTVAFSVCLGDVSIVVHFCGIIDPVNHYSQRLNAMYVSVCACMHNMHACLSMLVVQHLPMQNSINWISFHVNILLCSGFGCYFYDNKAAFFTHHIEPNAEFNSMRRNTQLFTFKFVNGMKIKMMTLFSQREYGCAKQSCCSLTVLVHFKRHQPTCCNRVTI